MIDSLSDSDLLLPPSANLTTSGWLEPGSARALKMLRNHCHYHIISISIIVIIMIIRVIIIMIMILKS